MNQTKTKRIELKVAGMSCAMCAQGIEGVLSRRAGVASAVVNLGAETVVVEYDPTQVGLAELSADVAEAGYQVVHDVAALKIGGMTCVMCVKAVEKALTKLPGVLSASVNLGAEQAHVVYNSSLTGLKEMKTAIEAEGYAYLGRADQADQGQEEAIRRRELRAKLRRWVVGLGISLPLMLLDHFGGHLPWPKGWVFLVLTGPAFVYVAAPIFAAALRAVRHGNLNMDVMYALGVGVAFGSSLLATAGVVGPEFLFYDTALMLASFLSLGRFLEARAKGKTSQAIRKLLGLQPKTALLVRDGVEVEVPVEAVGPGDLVVVKPGQRLPVDGVVTRGESAVDEAMITGEPLPVAKRPGEPVTGGTINGPGPLWIQASRVGRETVLAQIIRLVQEAQGSRPPVQRLADAVVAWFIPVVAAVALAAFLAWYLAGAGFLFALTTLIAILVIACPCALGLATPTAVTVGLGRGAELGILIKNGEALEASGRLTTVVFDKTGTLTTGRPAVTEVVGLGLAEAQVLALAAAVEKNSAHPLAQAVVAAAQAQGLDLPEAEGLMTLGGKGLTAQVAGQEVLVGNRALLEEQGWTIPAEAEAAASRLEEQGRTVALVGRAGQVVGALAIADQLKPTAPAAVAALQALGLKTALLTGDNRRTAQAVAGQVGIEAVLAQVLPQDKAAEVKRLQAEGQVVAFVGDGINDAPALAQADVGLAVGGGTDVAVESGDVVLMRDDLLDVVAAIQLSRQVLRRIRQNLFWAFAYNSALIPLAAGALHPLFGLTFRPELAGLAMAMSSVTVVTLSLTLKGYTPGVKKTAKR